jgi:hypothetical protein
MNPTNILIGGGIFCVLSLVYSAFLQDSTVDRVKERCESNNKIHIQIDASHYCMDPRVLEKIK